MRPRILAPRSGYVPVLPSQAEPEGDHTLLHRIAAFAESLPDDVRKPRDVHLELVKWIKDFNDTLRQVALRPD